MVRKAPEPDGDGVIGTVRPFADVLRDLGRGQIADEAAVLLTSLVQSVRAHGKKGTFTLKIDIGPMKGSSRNVLVAAQATIKPPAGEPTAAVFFDDATGNLHRNDPYQEELPLREVARPDAELRSAE